MEKHVTFVGALRIGLGALGLASPNAIASPPHQADVGGVTGCYRNGTGPHR